MKNYCFYIFLSLFLSLQFPAQKLIVNSDENISLRLDTAEVIDLIKLGNSYRDKLDLATSKVHFNEAITLSKKLDYKKGLARALNGKGYSFFLEAQLDSFFLCFTEALKYNTPIGDSMSMAASYMGLGHYYRMKSELATALNYYNKTVRMYKRAGNENAIGIVSNNIGNCYHMQGDYANAIIHYENSLRIKTKLKEKQGMSFALSNIGIINYEQGKYDAAEKQFKEVMKLSEEMDDKPALAKAHMFIGAVYESQKKYKESIVSHTRSLELKILSNDTNEVSFCYMNLGRVYRLMGESDKALDFHQKALVLAKRGAIPRDISLSYIELGEDHRQLKKYKEAEGDLLTAIDICTKGKDKYTAKSAYSILTKVYKEKGDFKKAVDAQEHYSALVDSIFSENSSKQIAEFNTKYQTEKKDNEIALLNSEKAKRDSEEQRKIAIRNQVIISISALALMIIGFIVILNYRKQKQRQKDFTFRIINSQEDERKRISKELHDGIGQNLLAIKSMREDPGPLLDATIEELRGISRNMHPVQLEKLGFEKAVESIINEAKKNSNILFTSEIEEVNQHLNPVQQINLYRIIQESISNIIRHSGTTSAKITIQESEGEIITTINDKRGKGFDLKAAKTKNSLGMVSMNERVNLMDGKLYMQSNSNGTQIVIILKYA